jgi:tripartite-type tricarboxylate transporter receptor subunit TctC
MVPVITRFALLTSTIAGLLLSLSAPAAAQSYPSRPIKIIVATPAGGIADLVGRTFAQKLTEAGKTAVVENRTGAGGALGAEAAARSAPDGYTLFVSNHQTNAVLPHLVSKLSYDPLKDFVPVLHATMSANILVVHPSVPAKSVQELIAYAKANPGKLNYASSGNGTTIHLSAELFKSMTGTSMNHIPYRGSAPAVNDLVGGQVDLMFDNATSIIGQVRGNTVKTLGVTSLKRSPLLPDLPTVSETVPGYDTASWFGIGVRAGVPNEVIEKVEEAAKALAQEAVVKERMAAVIADPVVSDRKSFGEFVVAERKKWGTLIKELNIKLD